MSAGVPVGRLSLSVSHCLREFVKSKVTTTIAVVAAVHLLLLWAGMGILKASGFVLISLFGPVPDNSWAQEFLIGLVGVLSYPMAWLTELHWLPGNWFTIILQSVVNSATWGVCLGLLISGFRQRCQRQAP